MKLKSILHKPSTIKNNGYTKFYLENTKGSQLTIFSKKSFIGNQTIKETLWDTKNHSYYS